jgi:hypothetical protein
MEPPPYRIETARLVIRCCRPTDAAALGEAVEESLDDLKRWMYWAHEEPKILTERVDLLRGLRGKFDRGEEFLYGIFSPTEDAVLGGVGLQRGLATTCLRSATGSGQAQPGKDSQPRRPPRLREPHSHIAPPSGWRSMSIPRTRPALASPETLGSRRRLGCGVASRRWCLAGHAVTRSSSRCSRKNSADRQLPMSALPRSMRPTGVSRDTGGAL